jgi:hypothetical protein
MYFRHLYGPGQPALIRDGHYVPEMPGAAALFVLARRERLDALRPFAFEDTDQDANSRVQNRTGLARRVFLAHYDLSEQLGEAMPATPACSDRWPTVPEWLAETARFAKRPDVVGAPGLGRLNPFDDVVHTPGLHPDPVVPHPLEQGSARDLRPPADPRLRAPPPLHPPHRRRRQALARRSERIAALVKGWNQALEAFPDAQRPAALKRLISSTGGSPDTLVELTALVDAQAGGGGPELHLDKPNEWIDLEPRLGNTGSASLFMGMAIGVMGSYIDGGGSAAINLRNPARPASSSSAPAARQAPAPGPRRLQEQRHPGHRPGQLSVALSRKAGAPARMSGASTTMKGVGQCGPTGGAARPAPRQD